MANYFVLFLLRPYDLLFAAQSVQQLRRRIIARCETHKNIGDTGPYSSVLECFRELSLMIKPKQVPKPKRKVACDLRDNLKGLYSVYEEHAKKGHKGLAGVIHAALTGIDSIESVKRARTSCLALQKSEDKSHAGAGGRRHFHSGNSSSRGSRGRGGYGRAPDYRNNSSMRDVQCHNCYGYGHFSSSCKKEKKKDA